MDYNLWQQLILNSTAPFRKGANILAQNYGSAITGKDMSQRENQGKFLKWLAEGLTPEEQEAINEKPILESVKSSAGMTSTLMPFTKIGNVANVSKGIANPMAGKLAQLLARGGIEGGVGGFGYSREGKELQDTLTGGAIGAGGEVIGGLISDPAFRNWMGRELKGEFKGVGGKYEAMLNLDSPELYSNVKLTDKAYKGADDLADKWGDTNRKDITTILEKLEQGGDKALNAEAEWIGQVFPDLTPEKQLEAVQRLDEIISTMLNPGQRQQVEFLKEYLPPVKGSVKGASVGPKGPGMGSKPAVIPEDYLDKPMKERLMDDLTLQEAIDLDKRMANLLKKGKDGKIVKEFKPKKPRFPKDPEMDERLQKIIDDLNNTRRRAGF